MSKKNNRKTIVTNNINTNKTQPTSIQEGINNMSEDKSIGENNEPTPVFPPDEIDKETTVAENENTVDTTIIKEEDVGILTMKEEVKVDEIITPPSAEKLIDALLSSVQSQKPTNETVENIPEVKVSTLNDDKFSILCFLYKGKILVYKGKMKLSAIVSKIQASDDVSVQISTQDAVDTVKSRLKPWEQDRVIYKKASSFGTIKMSL